MNKCVSYTTTTNIKHYIYNYKLRTTHKFYSTHIQWNYELFKAISTKISNNWIEDCVCCEKIDLSFITFAKRQMNLCINRASIQLDDSTLWIIDIRHGTVCETIYYHLHIHRSYSVLPISCLPLLFLFYISDQGYMTRLLLQCTFMCLAMSLFWRTHFIVLDFFAVVPLSILLFAVSFNRLVHSCE